VSRTEAYHHPYVRAPVPVSDTHFSRVGGGILADQWGGNRIVRGPGPRLLQHRRLADEVSVVVTETGPVCGTFESELDDNRMLA
jgi:hypothetical protein